MIFDDLIIKCCYDSGKKKSCILLFMDWMGIDV